MFIAWRDLRAARGRFALIATVVALIMLLVGFLSGLTGGLARQNVSALLSLPGDRLVVSAPDGAAPDISQSSLSGTAVDAWQDAAGVQTVTPVGIAQGRAQRAGAATGAAVALIGMPSASGAVGAVAPSADDEIGLSAGAAAALGAHPGDTVTVAGTGYRVALVGADTWYSHLPVVALTPRAWAAADQRLGGDGNPSVLAVTGSPDWSRVAGATSTSAAGRLASLRALPTFRSEIGSLALMIALLVGISALVVGAFFTVWTMQRAGDVAVLKALGASTASLVRDSLGQAAVVLAVGIGAGLAAVVGLGALAGGALPFWLSPLTTVVPAALMALLGLLGAAFSLRTVLSADPLTALGSTR